MSIKRMRLTIYELKTIVDTFDEVFGYGTIYLFGSRVDDSKKGGDIDLYLETSNKDNLFEKKIDFLEKVKDKIGEQKIDIVFAQDCSRLIEKEVMKTRVELNMNNIKLEKYFNECDKHIQRIEEAYTDLKDKIPLSSKDYINLDKDTVQALDQYIFRFSKLQDTMGNKVFQLLLSFYDETNENIPFLDLLNKLEKLEYIESAKEWIKLRSIRNNIAHQYDDEPEETSEAINNIVMQKEIIIQIYMRIKNKATRDLTSH